MRRLAQVDTKLQIELGFVSSACAGWPVYICFANALSHLSLDMVQIRVTEIIQARCGCYPQCTFGIPRVIRNRPSFNECRNAVHVLSRHGKKVPKEKESTCATRKRPLNWCLDSLKFTEARKTFAAPKQGPCGKFEYFLQKTRS